MEKVAILGSTGSIGKSTLDVLRSNKEKFSVVALAANNNYFEMIKQVKEFSPKLVAMKDKKAAEIVKKEVCCNNLKIVAGEEGLKEVATFKEASFVVSSIVGFHGLVPTVEAILAKKKLGLANKESLVIAGKFLMELVKKNNVTLLPIDSEHSAIFQCLQGEDRQTVEKVILTASGGPFLFKSREDLVNVTIAEVLQHPTWGKMGRKITVDSATMMNKGFEVIEAHYLFDIPLKDISVIIHKESIIHSLVEFCDGSLKAQLSVADMRIPIAYALGLGKRLFLKDVSRLFLTRDLSFIEPSYERFPCLKYAFDAASEGGTVPAVLTAANDIAVNYFLQGKCSFLKIEEVIEKTLSSYIPKKIKNPKALTDYLFAYKEGWRLALEYLN